VHVVTRGLDARYWLAIEPVRELLDGPRLASTRGTVQRARRFD
jgi:hypothetical protein